jgi:hypothetical protein
MRTDRQPLAAPPSAGIDIPHRSSERRVDRIDGPARPLGAKRAALQLRRQRALADRASTRAQATDPSALSFVSKDAAINFSLRATSLGLLLERTQTQLAGTRLVQSMVFVDQVTFERWCQSEPMRFDDPVLYDQLRRLGHAALNDRR